MQGIFEKYHKIVIFNNHKKLNIKISISYTALQILQNLIGLTECMIKLMKFFTDNIRWKAVFKIY